MSLLTKFVNGMGENKKEIKLKLKEAQQNQKVQKMLEEREKSSNQRFLERHFKEKREEQFKKQVAKINMQQSRDSWKGESILKGHKSILHEETKILENDNPILGKENIFLDNKSDNPLSGRSMFWK